MKFDKDMLKQLILIIVGVLAGLFGYDVIQGDDEVTIAMPEAAEEAPAEEEAGEEAEKSEEPAAEEEEAATEEAEE